MFVNKYNHLSYPPKCFKIRGGKNRIGSDKSVKFELVYKKQIQLWHDDYVGFPFFIRTAQWTFLDKQQATGKYIIARIFKNGGTIDVKYLKLNFRISNSAHIFIKKQHGIFV